MTASNKTPLAVVILAAGKGKRMGDPNKAKVLTLLNDKPLLEYVLQQTHQLNIARTVVIVGFQGVAVEAFVRDHHPNAICVNQSEQLGTGHAVKQAQSALSDANYNVLILSGDVPLVAAETLQAMMHRHLEQGADVTVLSTTATDPTGYGRVVVSDTEDFLRIVEQKDATTEELLIREINSGIYIVKSESLFTALNLVSNSNAQGEYYLTDIVSILNSQGKKVIRHHTPNHHEVQGINTPEDLQLAEGFV